MRLLLIVVWYCRFRGHLWDNTSQLYVLHQDENTDGCFMAYLLLFQT